MDQRLSGIEAMLYQIGVKVGAIEPEEEKPKKKAKVQEKEPVFNVED